MKREEPEPATDQAIDHEKKQKVESASEGPSSATILIVSDKFYMFGQYTGEWDDVTKKPHGNGRWIQSGALRYDGSWDQGQWSGHGTVYDEGGVRVCTGNYLNGSLHGFATLYHEDGETIDEEGYHIFGNEAPECKTEEEFLQKSTAIQAQAAAKEAAKPPPPPPTTTTTSFSMTLNKDSPIMSAPIDGLFPRYQAVPVKMLEGAGFPELDDDEIPTPTNLEAGKTREDWIVWVREFYPRVTNF